MDIAEAFNEEAIRAAGTNVGAAEEDELRELFVSIYDTNELTLPERDARDAANVAVLFFVAGRTYQEARDTIPVHMSRQMAGDFMEYLAQKGGS